MFSWSDGGTYADGDCQVVESCSFGDALDLGDGNVVQLLDCNKFCENLSVSISDSEGVPAVPLQTLPFPKPEGFGRHPKDMLDAYDLIPILWHTPVQVGHVSHLPQP